MALDSLYQEINHPKNEEEILIVEIDGFSGPLDLLLELSRKQKVDLRKISILQLVEQYVEFIENARVLKIDLAADYLVMAAWLALIKSRLLLPKDSDEENSDDELVARLAFRLQRLNAMRKSAKSIVNRPQLGQDFFARGEPERLSTTHIMNYSVNVLELTQAYAKIRSKKISAPFTVNREPIYSVEDALENMNRLLGEVVEWRDLLKFLPTGWTRENRKIRSALAATFTAALELARQGRCNLRQYTNFGPIQVRSNSLTDE